MKTAYLVGYPFLQNIGDHVLWEGCLKYLNQRFRVITDEAMLKRHGPYSNISGEVLDAFLSDLSSEDILFFKGGGYFNDYSGNFLGYACSILERVDQQKVFFLPQSIKFRRHSPLYEKLCSAFSDKQVHIIVREKVTHEIAEKIFPSCSIFLHTDMAFYLYPLELNLDSGRNSHGILFNLRNDGEEKRSFADYLVLYNILIPLLKSRTRVIVEDLMDLGFPTNHQFSLDIAIRRTSSFNLIVTDRLHGHILALLMNKPSILIYNDYHKNRSIYETWLQEVSISQIASSFFELPKKIRLLQDIDPLSASKSLASLADFSALDEYIFNRVQ